MSESDIEIDEVEECRTFVAQTVARVEDTLLSTRQDLKVRIEQLESSVKKIEGLEKEIENVKERLTKKNADEQEGMKDLEGRMKRLVLDSGVRIRKEIEERVEERVMAMIRDSEDKVKNEFEISLLNVEKRLNNQKETVEKVLTEMFESKGKYASKGDLAGFQAKLDHQLECSIVNAFENYNRGGMFMIANTSRKTDMDLLTTAVVQASDPSVSTPNTSFVGSMYDLTNQHAFVGVDVAQDDTYTLDSSAAGAVETSNLSDVFQTDSILVAEPMAVDAGVCSRKEDTEESATKSILVAEPMAVDAGVCSNKEETEESTTKSILVAEPMAVAGVSSSKEETDESATKRSTLITKFTDLPPDWKQKLLKHNKNWRMATHSYLNDVQRAYVKWFMAERGSKGGSPLSIADVMVPKMMELNIISGDEVISEETGKSRSLRNYLADRIKYENRKKKCNRESLDNLTKKFRKVME